MKQTQKQTERFAPCDIDLSSHLRNTFGKCEIEDATCKLIQFLVETGRGWNEIHIGDLVDFYRQKGWNTDEIMFGLFGSWIDDGCWRTWKSMMFTNWGNGIVPEQAFFERIKEHVRKLALPPPDIR